MGAENGKGRRRPVTKKQGNKTRAELRRRDYSRAGVFVYYYRQGPRVSPPAF